MPANPSIVSTAIVNLQRLADVFCERREQLAREAGLTVQQWCVLEKISEEHFMPSMFARNRDSSAAAVSKVIRQLLDKGVIQVGVREHDGRQRRYTLTAAGERAVEKLRDSRHRAIEAVWSGLDDRELEQFTEFSEELADRLEAYIRSQREFSGAAADPDEPVLSGICAPIIEKPAPLPVPRTVITSTNKFID